MLYLELIPLLYVVKGVFFLLMEFRVFGFPAAGVEGPPKLEILQKSKLVPRAFVPQPHYSLLTNPVGNLATVLGWNTPAVGPAD